MSYYLSPLANNQQSDSNGNPLSGGKVCTYVAGTSTPATTYTDDTGGTAQQNPILLNSRGLPASPVWLQGGRSFKFVITDANDVVLQTVDDVTGINDPAVASSSDQWVVYANSPTYISATSFSLAGDQTPTFQVGRRLKTANTGGLVYSTILTSVFAAGITTITVSNDSGTLDSGLSAVSYGLISVANTSLPKGPLVDAYQQFSQAVAHATFTKVEYQAENSDSSGAFASSRFQPGVAGWYQVTATCGFLSAVAPAILSLYKNGAEHKRGWHANSSTVQTVVSAFVYLNGTSDYVEAYVYQGSGGSIGSDNTATNTYFQACLVRGA